MNIQLPSDFFGMGCFYHIKAVADNAAMITKQFGAEMAKEILEKFDYDKEKIVQVQSCVLKQNLCEAMKNYRKRVRFFIEKNLSR